MATRSTNRGAMTVSEAGRKGGKKRAQALGHTGYQALGKKGGMATRDKYGPQHYSKIGKKGGKARTSSRRQAGQ
jgi:uncharacterized protein